METLNIERIMLDPAPMTGMTKAEFDGVRRSFSGTDKQLVQAAILFFLRPSHSLLGELTGVSQVMVTKRFKVSEPLFVEAYRKHFSREPVIKYVRPAGKLNVLRSRCPKLTDFFSKAVALAA